MKRSEINLIQASSLDILAQHSFYLPLWAFWSREEWQYKGSECDEIREKHLGWDITDFGLGDFNKYGLTLFTLRNGSFDSNASRNYCEKIMIVLHEQYTPEHYHVYKTEDIINRGGSDLMIYLRHADQRTGVPLHKNVSIQCDGITKILKPQELLRLKPGESITLEPYIYHTFCGCGGTVLVGEVSRANDDYTDNFFLDKIGRFPEIVEDVAPLYMLCFEYPTTTPSSIERVSNLFLETQQ